MKFYLAIIALFALTSCVERDQIRTISTTVSIDLSTQNQSDLELSSVFSEIKYVPLETTNVYLGAIDKMVIHDNRIYLFDYYQTKSLQVFDIRGKHLLELSKEGQGPEEYQEVSDFLVNRESISILDVSNDILVFDHEGIFKERIKLPFDPYKFIADENGEYIFYLKQGIGSFANKEYGCQIISFNPTDNSTNCLLETYESPLFFNESNVLSKNNGKAYFSTIFNDTIFEIAGNRIKKFILDFGKDALESGELKKQETESDMMNFLNRNQNRSYHVPWLLASENALVSRFNRNGPKHFIFLKKSKEVFIIDKNTLNDLNVIATRFFPYALVDDYLVTITEPLDIKETAERINPKPRENLTEQEKAFLSFAEGVNVNSNIILTFLQIRPL